MSFVDNSFFKYFRELDDVSYELRRMNQLKKLELQIKYNSISLEEFKEKLEKV